MKKLIIYNGDSPVYVEGFSEGCKRSVKGSLHILPKKAVSVTQDEYDHIMTKYPEMKTKIKVIAESKAEVQQESLAEASPEKVEASSEPVGEPVSEEVAPVNGDERPNKKKKF